MQGEVFTCSAAAISNAQYHNFNHSRSSIHHI
uniref:Uncharacterized protein n=1 Tax=Rhizophora mucronata TaxID=61149 RepID=A0A2P2PR19_RHIMU